MSNIQITEEILTNDISEILDTIKDDEGKYSMEFYIIKNTQSRAKDKKRWYRVYVSDYENNARIEFLNETVSQLDNILNRLKKNHGIEDFLKPNENNGNNTIETIGENITLLQESNKIETLSEIINQIIQGGYPPKEKKYKNEKIIGYALDINLGNLGRVIAFIKSKNIKMIKKGNLVQYGSKLMKLEKNILLIPSKIDALYLKYNGKDYVIILGRTEFERLFKFYEYYKEKTKECLNNIAKSGFIVINSNIEKEILNSARYTRKFSQVHARGIFNFYDKNGNLIEDKYNKFIKLLKNAKNHKKIKKEVSYEIKNNNGISIVNIPSKDALLWFLKICNGEVLPDFTFENVYFAERTIQYQEKLDRYFKT